LTPWRNYYCDDYDYYHDYDYDDYEDCCDHSFGSRNATLSYSLWDTPNDLLYTIVTYNKKEHPTFQCVYLKKINISHHYILFENDLAKNENEASSLEEDSFFYIRRTYCCQLWKIRPDCYTFLHSISWYVYTNVCEKVIKWSDLRSEWVSEVGLDFWL